MIYNELMRKKTVLGIVAHVDAGKTTLVENLLFQTKTIQKLGRVDYKNSFLDYDHQERERGITIYSKEAYFTYRDCTFYLMDTPGHTDFASEMERSLSVLDMAIVLINGQDGVQPHSKTIWNILKKHHIPTILFVNKMDISYLKKEEIYTSIQKELSPSCLDWKSSQKEEELILASDALLNAYEKQGSLDEIIIQEEFQNRSFFPALFGSALKGDGVLELLDLLAQLSIEKNYPETLGAIVYKVTSDTHGRLLAHVKITGGEVHVKEKLEPYGKIDQIRLYQGALYDAIECAKAGMLVTLKGLENIHVGMGLGYEMEQSLTSLQACMTYRLLYPKGTNLLALKESLNRLSLEDPSLNIEMDEENKDIQIHLMGKLQKEVLAKRIDELCQVEVSFDQGRIVYLETISKSIKGASHFEPLRHYAEVHLELSPLKKGSGIEIENKIPADTLSLQFQKSILSVLEKKNFYGVLTNSLLTDVKITLLAGKGSLKHTTGGDFRQATRRAVRQALMKTESVLLEPYLQFEIRIPSNFLSKVLFDLENRFAKVEVESLNEEWMRVCGKAPVSTMADYQVDILSSTKGLGRYEFVLVGYAICHNSEEVIQERKYKPNLDLRNPSSSLFCAHGTSYTVEWNEADDKMDIQLEKESSLSSYVHKQSCIHEEDLKRILARTNSNNRNEHKVMAKKIQEKKEKSKQIEHRPKVLMVDGYNMLFAWQRFQNEDDFMLKREELIEILSSYQAYTKELLFLVFDGYRVKNNLGNQYQKGKMSVIYTAESQSADAYIEKYVYEHQHEFDFEVASSDALIQNSVFASGAKRLSARELENRIDFIHHQIQEELEVKR